MAGQLWPFVWATEPYLQDCERIQVAPDTLTCRVNRGGPVLILFFGGLGIGCVQAPDQAGDMRLKVASLLDIAGTKAAVVQKRAEVKDYADIDALLQAGIDLPTIQAAGRVVYGRRFNPLITLKALSYFGDLPALSTEIRARICKAVQETDAASLPSLKPYAECSETGASL